MFCDEYGKRRVMFLWKYFGYPLINLCLHIDLINTYIGCMGNKWIVSHVSGIFLKELFVMRYDAMVTMPYWGTYVVTFWMLMNYNIWWFRPYFYVFILKFLPSLFVILSHQKPHKNTAFFVIILYGWFYDGVTWIVKNE